MIRKCIIIGIQLLLAIGLCLISCSGVVNREELTRIKSPDSVVDAVLVRTNVDATTPYGYKLYIVPTRKEPKVGDELLQAENLVNVTISWKKPRFLEIRYEKGRIFSFRNFWHSKEVQNFEYIVELRLVPLTESFSLK